MISAYNNKNVIPRSPKEGRILSCKNSTGLLDLILGRITVAARNSVHQKKNI